MVDKIFKLVIIFAILLIAVSVSYYYVYFIPQKERAKLELQKQEQAFKQQQELEAINKVELEKEYNQTMLDACMKDAFDSYDETWTSNCKTSGIDKKTAGCSLPSETADSVNEYYKMLRNDCFKKYPQK